MGINVEVDQVILSGEPFDVTLSVDEGELPGIFRMMLEIAGRRRDFAVQLGSRPASPPARSQVVSVHTQVIWTVREWGIAAPGSSLVVTLAESIAVNARSGADRARIMPGSQL